MQLVKRPIRQVAYYTDDLVAAARRHSATFGSGPFFTGEAPCRGLYRGEPVEFTGRMCLGQWGEVMVEFIGDTGVPTVLNELPLEGRRERPHHVALIVDDLDAEIARLEAVGYPAAMIASINANPDFRYAFMDSVKELGYFIEVYPGMPSLLQTYEKVRQASIGWDGRDPLRELSR